MSINVAHQRINLREPEYQEGETNRQHHYLLEKNYETQNLLDFFQTQGVKQSLFVKSHANDNLKMRYSIPINHRIGPMFRVCPDFSSKY